jgi:hypothetical protein
MGFIKGLVKGAALTATAIGCAPAAGVLYLGNVATKVGKAMSDDSNKNTGKHAGSVIGSPAGGIMPLALMIFVVLTYGFTTAEAQAEAVRHHEAHVHGVAHMNVAVEGDTVYIEFSSPAANIVGFEHHPETAEQKKAIKASIAKLKAGDKLFKLSSKAQGKLTKSVVDTDIANALHPEPHAEHSDEHAKHHKSDKKHGQEHHHADEHERHSEFKTEYRFVCKKPEKLAHIEVMLFDIFPGIEHIEVQILTEKTQTALELTARKYKIAL